MNERFQELAAQFEGNLLRLVAIHGRMRKALEEIAAPGMIGGPMAQKIARAALAELEATNAEAEEAELPSTMTSDSNPPNGHTPGPWVAEGRPPNMIVIFAGETTGNRPSPCLLMDGNQEANARLIEASPKMLAALKMLVVCDDRKWRGEHYVRDRAQALAEARVLIKTVDPDWS